MACSCAIIKSDVSTITVGQTTVLLVPDTDITISNKQRFGLRITSAISGGNTLPVYATINGVTTQVLDRYGNIVYGNQLKQGQTIFGYFGNNGIGGAVHLIATKVNNPYCV